MGMPKGYITNINIHPSKIGVERRQEILDGIANKGTFLPKGVSIEDMDKAFIESVNTDFGITIDGQKVPVIFLTIQRWSEFSRTWKFADDYKNITLPFVTIVRKPDIQEGQNQAGLWNIPGNRTYTYMKVPTWDGIRKGVDVYQVPQPTPVDITYEVRLFTNRMRDLNKFSSLVRRTFQSRQFYIDVNGHPMPLYSETTGDESVIEDFENRRFYVITFEIRLSGYILDESDFKVIPTINKVVALTEIEPSTFLNDKVFMNTINDDKKLIYSFVFKPKAEPQFSFVAPYDLSFLDLVDVVAVNRIVITVNGVSQFDGLVFNTPIKILKNDVVGIRIYKNFYDEGTFKLIGNTQ